MFLVVPGVALYLRCQMTGQGMHCTTWFDKGSSVSQLSDDRIKEMSQQTLCEGTEMKFKR